MSGAPVPADGDYVHRVRESAAGQRVLSLIGARLVHVGPGEVDLEFDHSPDLTQQHGFIHAGILSTVLDSACGYAAYSLMPADAGVLTIEFKINLLSPARGERFVARGRVTKPGRVITVADGTLVAVSADGEKPIATMTGTLMTVRDREAVRG